MDKERIRPAWCTSVKDIAVPKKEVEHIPTFITRQKRMQKHLLTNLTYSCCCGCGTKVEGYSKLPILCYNCKRDITLGNMECPYKLEILPMKRKSI